MRSLFEFAVVYTPKDETLEPSIIKAATMVLATSAETAQHIAISELDAKWKYAISNGEVKVYVRPFK